MKQWHKDAADAVISRLLTRLGFEYWWDDQDADTKDEIRRECARDIADADSKDHLNEIYRAALSEM